jgi:hypothetical protein
MCCEVVGEQVVHGADPVGPYGDIDVNEEGIQMFAWLELGVDSL